VGRDTQAFGPMATKTDAGGARGGLGLRRSDATGVGGHAGSWLTFADTSQTYL
jgi:hypothetical protein